MSEIIKSIALDLAAEVYDNLNPAYDKYATISDLRSIDFGTLIKNNLADIIERNSLIFFKLIQDSEIGYSYKIPDVENLLCRLLAMWFKDSNISFVDSVDDGVWIKIDDSIYNFNERNNYFPFHADLIEFVTLSVFNRAVTVVQQKTNSISPDQEFFNVTETAAFLGLKKSYVYKLKSEGELKARQSKSGGALRFKRDDLLDFMLRKESLTINDIIH